MPMTLQQLVKISAKSRKELMSTVKVGQVKVRKNAEGYPMALAKMQSLQDAKGKAKYVSQRNTYLGTIEFFPKKYVIVSCSCDDYCFTWEYANNRKGASRIEYCNGEAPGVRNPSETPGLCKHLLAMAKYLVDKGMV